MYRNIQSILSFLLLLLLAVTNAQVHIGDGVTISKGTTFVIVDSEVNIDTEKINGEGVLLISNDKEQLITVHKNLESTADIQVNAQKTSVNGQFAANFRLEHLPSLTSDIIVAKKQAAQKELPVRYINTEGLVYDTPVKEKPVETYNELPNNVHHGVVVTEVMQSQAVQNYSDYIIPIYSVTLNDERFSDYAELYEFESLTAIFKPPIV